MMPPPNATASTTTEEDRIHNFASGPPPLRQLPDDCIGSSSKAAAETMLAFVQEWKQERQWRLQQMAARQEKLAGKQQRVIMQKGSSSSKPKKKKPKPARASNYYRDDDDEDDILFCDSDDDEIMINRGLPALCLLTGLTGCGKSALVHAVAAQCDCPVLEMSTADRRGAAALRKAVGEATQSHANWKKQQQQQSSQAVGSLFGAKKKQEEVLVDSDSDDDDDKEATGSSLTVILLDEVDNLYEQDAGFWVALAELSKTAKCPIFLTANSFPEQLHSTTYHLKHVPIETPSPSECVPALRQWIQQCGGSVTGVADEHVDAAATDAVLEQVATLCHCDVRRMAYELLRFSYRSLDPKTATGSPLQHGPLLPASGRDDDEDGMEVDGNSVVDKGKSEQEASLPKICQSFQRPTVQRVEPRGVRSSEYALVTITGANFLSLIDPAQGQDKTRGYPVQVFVGARSCPQARIMDDSTILAVCPPVPPGTKKAGGAARERHLSFAYSAIRVCGSRKLGLFSDSAGAIDEPADSVSLPALTKPVYLERHFPGSIESLLFAPPSSTTSPNAMAPPKDDESDQEFEFKEESDESASSQQQPKRISDSAMSEQDLKTVNLLLLEGIGAWCSRNDVGEPATSAFDAPSSGGSLEEMQEALQESIAWSDAAVLEDMASMPHLAGSCNGFGFDLTDSFPKYTNDKNKRPSEDALFTSGWKDNAGFFGSSDTYMTLPLTRRERKLLAKSEQCARGFSFPEAMTSNDEEPGKEKKFIPVESSEEDRFLPNEIPAPILLLPCLLQQQERLGTTTTASLSSLRRSLNGRIVQETSKRRDHLFDWVDQYIFVVEKRRNQHFFCDIHRTCQDPLLSVRDSQDPRLWLDYLPVVRCMAVLDQVGAIQYRNALSLDPEGASAVSNRKRRTRQSQRKGYSYYLEKTAPGELWRLVEDNVQVKDLVEAMGEYVLR